MPTHRQKASTPAFLAFIDDLVQGNAQFLASVANQLPSSEAIRRDPGATGQSLLSMLLRKKYIEDFHSTMINYLLSHKAGASRPYLALFLSFLQRSYGVKRLSVTSLEIHPEYKADGRIDLVLLDDTAKEAIIIENKIYATDQVRQIPKYYFSLVEANYSVIATLYLTLTGKQPDKKGWSAADHGFPIIPLAYYSQDKPNLYDGWLVRCIAFKDPIAHVAREYGEIVLSLEEERIMRAAYRRFVKYLISHSEAQESLSDILENAETIDRCLAAELHRHFKSILDNAFKGVEAEESTEGYYLAVPVGDRFEYMLYYEDGSLGVGFRCRTKDATKKEKSKCLHIIGENASSNDLWIAFKEIETISVRNLAIFRYFDDPKKSDGVVRSIRKAIASFQRAT